MPFALRVPGRSCSKLNQQRPVRLNVPAMLTLPMSCVDLDEKRTLTIVRLLLSGEGINSIVSRSRSAFHAHRRIPLSLSLSLIELCKWHISADSDPRDT